LRAAAHVDSALEAGAARVVVGTAAYEDSPTLANALAAHGERVAVAVDVRDGRVSAAGWTRDTGLEPLAAIAELQERGVRALVYTNVDRDGMLEGPDLDEIRRVGEAVRGRFLYSGGIASLADLQALRDLRLVNLAGVISGKALYEGRFGVAEGQAVLDS
jgi:phosphoribosylformimino-5-aminoimidazole carboxamide ribotide isomerase